MAADDDGFAGTPELNPTGPHQDMGVMLLLLWHFLLQVVVVWRDDAPTTKGGSGKGRPSQVVGSVESGTSGQPREAA